MVTIDNIVLASGVSRSTVCRFLSGKKVRPASQDAISKALKKLNFRLDVLEKKKSISIEIRKRPLMRRSSETSRYRTSFGSISSSLNTIINKCNKLGINVNIVYGNDDNISTRPDGVIIVSKHFEEERADIERFKAEGIPVVMLYRNYDDVSCVTCDNYQAVYDITQMFVDKGHKKIAICGDILIHKNSMEKLEGYLDCLNKNGIAVDETLICKETNLDNAAGWLSDLIDKGKAPTALITMNDLYALSLTTEANKHSLKIPDDLSVVGMDNTDLSLLCNPPVSTVDIPFEEMGELAVETLVELIKNPRLKTIKKVLDYKLIIRESSPM